MKMFNKALSGIALISVIAVQLSASDKWANFKNRISNFARRTLYSTPVMMHDVSSIADNEIVKKLEQRSRYQNRSPFLKLYDVALMLLAARTFGLLARRYGGLRLPKSNTLIKGVRSLSYGACATGAYDLYQAHNPNFRTFYINPKAVSIYDSSFVQGPFRREPYLWSKKQQPLPGSIPVIYKPESLSSFFSETKKPAQFYVKDSDANALKTLSTNLTGTTREPLSFEAEVNKYKKNMQKITDVTKACIVKQ